MLQWYKDMMGDEAESPVACCPRCGGQGDFSKLHSFCEWKKVHRCGHSIKYMVICEERAFSSSNIGESTSEFVSIIAAQPCLWCGGPDYGNKLIHDTWEGAKTIKLSDPQDPPLIATMLVVFNEKKEDS